MIKVYFASKTRAVRIIWLLEELNLPYELHRLNFTPKDLKSEEYRKVHPTRKSTSSLKMVKF